MNYSNRYSLLLASGLCALLATTTTAQPTGETPAGPAPSRQNNQPPRAIDPQTDAVLMRINAVLSPTAEQFTTITARYTKLRDEQRAIVREIMQRTRDGVGAGAAGEGNRPAPLSPELRTKVQAEIKEKTESLSAAFLTDVKATLTDGQKPKFDALAKELDLAPALPLLGQRGGRDGPPGGPPGGPNAARDSKPFDLKNSVKIEEKDGFRIITSNGIPDHEPGRFPNSGNPNAISEQKQVLRVTLTPKANEKPTPGRMEAVGVALNGVLFDPGTAENWNNDPRSGWRQEAISVLTAAGAKMGIDTSNAHVQPTGSYHYHALPTGLVKRLAAEKGTKVGETMILLGWAADGFPIYDFHGYSKADDAKSPIKELHSSYKLKAGNRPDDKATPPGPGGTWDGSYTKDFEYIAGSGDLDECNGRTGVTPEFPNGTYYYVITGEFPFISRMYKGTPDASFAKGPPGGRQGGGQGGQGGNPGGQRRGPGGGPGGPGGN